MLVLYTYLLDFANSFLMLLPDVEPLQVPEAVESGFTSIFALLGAFAPYYLYKPLFVFIIALTSFRIVYSFYITFKK